MELQGLGNSAADHGRRGYYWGREFLFMVTAKGRAMISAFIPFLITPLGRWAAICGMIAVAWFGFASHYKKVGAERVTAQIEKKVEANAQKANQVRNSVQSVPANSLRDKWTRE